MRATKKKKEKKKKSKETEMEQRNLNKMNVVLNTPKIEHELNSWEMSHTQSLSDMKKKHRNIQLCSVPTWKVKTEMEKNPNKSIWKYSDMKERKWTTPSAKTFKTSCCSNNLHKNIRDKLIYTPHRLNENRSENVALFGRASASTTSTTTPNLR